MQLFEGREEHILTGVSRRLKSGLDDGGDQFDVFNEAQDHVILAARAHVEAQVIGAFSRAVEACEDEALRPVLEKLFNLYALSLMEDERGWFFEHGRMTGPRAKAITRTINRVCAELREQADVLVDAWGIPDVQLGALGARPA